MKRGRVVAKARRLLAMVLPMSRRTYGGHIQWVSHSLSPCVYVLCDCGIENGGNVVCQATPIRGWAVRWIADIPYRCECDLSYLSPYSSLATAAADASGYCSITLCWAKSNLFDLRESFMFVLCMCYFFLFFILLCIFVIALACVHASMHTMAEALRKWF